MSVFDKTEKRKTFAEETILSIIIIIIFTIFRNRVVRVLIRIVVTGRVRNLRGGGCVLCNVRRVYNFFFFRVRLS